MAKKTKHNPASKWLLISTAIFLILLFFLTFGLMLYEHQYEGRIYPGVRVNGLELGGLTPTQALNAINQRINQINEQGIAFEYDYYEVTVHPLISSLSGDLAYEIINFDAESTVNNVVNFGRSSNVIINTKNKLQALILGVNLPASNTVNIDGVKEILLESFSKFDTPAQDANIVYAKNAFTIVDEKYGQSLDYNKAISDLKYNLDNLNNYKITFEAKIEQPTVFRKDIKNIEKQANLILQNTPITLGADTQKWTLTQSMIIDWLKLKKKANQIIIGLDENKVQAFFEENIFPKVNIEPVDAKLEIKDGKVSEFKASQDGKAVILNESLALIEEAMNTGNKTVELVITVTKSKIKTEDINDLGIREIIGTGHSNYAGSPTNRIHNIGIGAASLNGVLLAPGEEFSLLKTLGKIGPETGYRAELVIKENRTTPEFGGGLCQVGTTIFRATYDSGLPVTMRRNHSYRVSYYEPAGTDATIYDPWPDYKFINDTKHHILIQTRNEYHDLYFDIWGTKDGRVATHTEPTIYNITSPGATKIIETTDLAPGVKRCTESAHYGADAYFDYKVEYPEDNPPTDAKDDNDLIRETRFRSHYVPWQAVCLLGVEELTSNIQTATTTPVIAE